MRSGILIGRDHQVIGDLAVIGEGPAAIALSRGGASKTYEHTEPNEDAVLFAFSDGFPRGGGALIAVADGHHGSSGSQAALEHLRQVVGPSWLGEIAGANAGRLLREISTSQGARGDSAAHSAEVAQTRLFVRTDSAHRTGAADAASAEPMRLLGRIDPTSRGRASIVAVGRIGCAEAGEGDGDRGR